MNETILARSSAALETSLARSFVDGMTWPIGCAALAALLDMGMSESQIAGYFSVELPAVHALRRDYGLKI